MYPAQRGMDSSQPLPSEDAQLVRIGLYSGAACNLDQACKSIDIGAYVWPSWKGEIDLLLMLEFIDALEEWRKRHGALWSGLSTLKDSSRYQSFKMGA